MNTRAFKTEQEVKEFFFRNLTNQPSPVMVKAANAGIIVDTKLRREILTGENCGKIIINGRVRSFNFTNMKGGVWLCTLNH